MTANELADELEKRHLLGGYASEAATMLRQQQAEIERLTMLCDCMTTESNRKGNEIEALKAAKIRAYNNGVEDGRKPDTNNKPVAWIGETLMGKKSVFTVGHHQFSNFSCAFLLNSATDFHHSSEYFFSSTGWA